MSFIAESGGAVFQSQGFPGNGTDLQGDNKTWLALTSRNSLLPDSSVRETKLDGSSRDYLMVSE